VSPPFIFALRLVSCLVGSSFSFSNKGIGREVRNSLTSLHHLATSPACLLRTRRLAHVTPLPPHLFSFSSVASPPHGWLLKLCFRVPHLTFPSLSPSLFPLYFCVFAAQCFAHPPTHQQRVSRSFLFPPPFLAFFSFRSRACPSSLPTALQLRVFPPFLTLTYFCCCWVSSLLLLLSPGLCLYASLPSPSLSPSARVVSTSAAHPIRKAHQP
jgi:hypothetical protein